jgi:hypothetical protein
MSAAAALFRIVSERESKRAEQAEKIDTAWTQKKTGAASLRQLAAPVHAWPSELVTAGDAIMTGADAWPAGTHDTVTATDLAAQRMGDPVACSAGVAGDDVAIMSQFAAHGIATLLGLSQRAQRQQYGNNA